MKAGAEYVEISREVRNLHGVLRALGNEAHQEESIVFKQDQSLSEQLSTAADGCTGVLLDIDNLLRGYAGLNPERGVPSKSRRAWHRFRFGFKIENLAGIRSKLIICTSTISVLLDTMQLKATGRVECKIDDGIAKVMGSFDHMRKAIDDIAARARATEDTDSMLSLSSLSTHTEDDKEVWRQFRRELHAQGFRGCTLDNHRDVLQAYMLRLNKSGILDADKPWMMAPVAETPWWARRECLDTLHFRPGEGSFRHQHRHSAANNLQGVAVTHHNSPSPQCSDAPSRHLRTPPGRQARPPPPISTETQNGPSQVEDTNATPGESKQQNKTQLCTLPPSPKSILRPPRAKFPEPPTLTREGVAPLIDVTKSNIPPNARWTRLSTKLVSPVVLASRRERYEARPDHVIILRVLSMEEVHWYAEMTHQVRGKCGRRTLRFLGG